MTLMTDTRAAALAERAARLHGSGDLAGALRGYDELVASGAADAAAWCARGNVLADLGRMEPALASYDRSIALDSGFAEAHDYRGIVLAQAGRMLEALDSLDHALALAPTNLNALNNRANILKSLGRLDEALAAQDQMLAALPAFAPGHNNRGNILIALGRHAEAVASFDRALALDPSLVQAHLNRANALIMLVRREEAIESYRRALALDPRQPEALVNLAELLTTLRRRDEARHCYERAVALAPDSADAWLGLGDVLIELNRSDLAIGCFERAIACRADLVEAHAHLGVALSQVDRRADALASLDRAIALDSDDAQIWQARGLLLEGLGDMVGALASHERALAIMPGFPCEAGQAFHTAMRLSQWADFDLKRARLCDAVRRGERASSPFHLLGIVDDAALQRHCSEIFARHELQHLAQRPIERKYPHHARVRIGYFSADFRAHATMSLFMETLEAHDRTRFELFAFSFGADTRDAWRLRTEAAVDRFIDVRAQSDRSIAELARELEIDIAVDLKGYTRDHRTPIFVHRAAPIQVSYLGFPGTLGLPTMDYLLGDAIVIPEGAEQHYSEKIVYLPDSYQPNNRPSPLARNATRSSEGLPERAMVYCCFNQSYKIVPAQFDTWLRILDQVPHGVLWLWAGEAVTRGNLRARAIENGIDPDRLIFASRLAPEAHFDRLRLADLFLDTVPCNAHTTASDALRTGLPLLTCPGESFAARVAASLLHAVGLPELVAADHREYEAIAIALGTDADRRTRVREKLARGLDTSSLFDPVRSARKLEQAYLAMYERYRNDQQPDHIRI